jgi:hypothetical protein
MGLYFVIHCTSLYTVLRYTLRYNLYFVIPYKNNL